MEIKEKIENELRQLTPGLPLQQQATFQLPNGYFEQLPTQLLVAAKTAQEKKARIAQLQSNQWKFLAAAAVTMGIVFFSYYYFTATEGDDAINQWAKQEINKVPAEHIVEYVDNTHAVTQVSATGQLESNDLALLVQDIPQEEIQRLLNDLPATEMP